MTLEYSALEPGIFAHKYYAPGTGLIAEVEDGGCLAPEGIIVAEDDEDSEEDDDEPDEDP